MADQVGNIIIRDYRKGNWTLGETMVLIEAKKMDDERRMKRSSDHNSELGGGGRSKPAELRWKWVEDYCFGKGCLRSQNQCNDKWDNLMRDYKRVRDYERRLLEITSSSNNNNNNNNEPKLLSYWKLEKNERKDKNLPSNMLLQVYEALVEVVEKKGGQRMLISGNNSNPNLSYGVVERLPISSAPPPPLLLPPLLQHQVSVSIPLSPLPPPPPPPPPLIPQQPQTQALPPLQYSQPLPAAVVSDADETSEYSDTPAKRRRRRRDGGGGGEERSCGSGGSASTTMEMGNAISRSASVIAEAIQACEERKERRHRDLLKLQERRLQMEETNTETNRKSINGLVDAINNLANSILALASHKKS